MKNIPSLQKNKLFSILFIEENREKLYICFMTYSVKYTLVLDEQFCKNTRLIFAQNLGTNYEQYQPQQKKKLRANKTKLFKSKEKLNSILI